MPSAPFARWFAARRRRRDEVDAESLESDDIEPVSTTQAPEPSNEPEPEPEPEAVVSERVARAILASGPPPLPAEQPKAERKPARRRLIERRREPLPEPESQPLVAGPPREWNIWELQRAVRTADDHERQQEWTALFLHLREFASAEGDLPVEFDALVRESFAAVLERRPETAAS